MNENNAPYFKKNGDKIDISRRQTENFTGKRPAPIKAYGNGISKRLGVILKIVAFLVAFANLAIGGVLAFIIHHFFNGSFDIIALAVFMLTAVIGLICLFVFYAFGHIICQNNEIIRKLNEDK